MKHYALLGLAGLLLSPAFAQAKTEIYKGEAVYTKPGLSADFYQLEQLGVEREAEKRAYRACVAAGATDCVILNDAIITKCNRAYDLYSTGCWGEAHARGTVQ